MKSVSVFCKVASITSFTFCCQAFAKFKGPVKQYLTYSLSLRFFVTFLKIDKLDFQLLSKNEIVIFFLKKNIITFCLKRAKMKVLMVCYFSMKTPYLAKFMLSSYYPGYCQTIKNCKLFHPNFSKTNSRSRIFLHAKFHPRKEEN